MRRRHVFVASAVLRKAQCGDVLAGREALFQLIQIMGNPADGHVELDDGWQSQSVVKASLQECSRGIGLPP